MLIERKKLEKLWWAMEIIVPEPADPERKRGAPMQDLEECWWLIKRLSENGQLNTIIELGTADGGGLKIWEQLLKPGDTLITVDWSPNILWDWGGSDRNIQSIKGNTHEEETRSQVTEALNGKKADFLFIDAQHHPADVQLDAIDYGGFVRDNGIIGFHDTRLTRSWWDEFTGGGIDASDNPRNRQESDVFHKEEIKLALGTGIFWKLPNQTVVKFREI
jgi:23S rRNA U2552 (ribose-2'-O)-methylase RlmE/FtsJ